MSRKQPDLTINGLAMPLRIGAEIEQTYEDFGAFTLLRLGNGAAVPQQAWRRTRTSLSARGIAPPGLSEIDWMAPITLGCVAARSIQSAARVITVPAARRTDAAPYGWAITAAGLLQPTPVTLAGHVATLEAVPGAAAYQVAWYPLLTGYAPAGVSVSFDAAGAAASWQIVFEEE